MAERGTVYLVGAGPGAADLITLRGLRLLRCADVVVYDRLVGRELLAEAAAGARRIYVGKRPGHHPWTQSRINALLLFESRRQRVVVRLKGGDPFVFGRGGEECRYLEQAGVPFQVVPGISSALAAPALAGIPLTQRGTSSEFAVVTGHGCADGTPAPDWAALSRVRTLVVLMGLAHLEEICQQLIAGGRSPDTPVAVVFRASTPQQSVVRGVLSRIASQVGVAESPATIVIGQVVSGSVRAERIERPEGHVA